MRDTTDIFLLRWDMRKMQGSFCACARPMRGHVTLVMLQCNIVCYWLGAYTKWSMRCHHGCAFKFSWYSPWKRKWHCVMAVWPSDCPPHHGQTCQYHGHEFRSMSIGGPNPEIKVYQTLTLKFQLQGQGHGCGQRARSYNQPSIILTHLVFISHQSDQQFLK